MEPRRGFNRGHSPGLRADQRSEVYKLSPNGLKRVSWTKRLEEGCLRQREQLMQRS